MLLNFDYDGVIVDSLSQLLAIAITAQQQLGAGRTPTIADFATITQLTFTDLGRQIGLAEQQLADYAETVFSLQKSTGMAVPKLFSGMAQVLSALSQQHCLVIITASSSTTVLQTLQRYELDTVFSAVLGGELGLSKTQRIEQARERYQFDTDATVMIGDAISDIRAGKMAGVTTIAVTWGFQDSGLLIREQPDYLVHTPDELLATVQSI